MKIFNKINELANQEHEGAVAFEYVIILIIMAVALFVGFTSLSNALKSKATEVSTFINGNGQGALGTAVAK